MNHAQAHTIALALVHKFAPYCQHINIGGSLRRNTPESHDIDIVAIPKSEQVTADLFGGTTTIYPIQTFIHDGIMAGDWRKIKGAQKYIQLGLPEGINLDLNLVTPPAQYGVKILLHTGPDTFNHWLVTARRHGGRMPSNAVMRGGAVYVNGILVPMPDEISALTFFLGGWIPPEKREAHWEGQPSTNLGIRENPSTNSCYTP